MTSIVTAREALGGLRAYNMDAPPHRFNLADNTSAYGPPPSAVDAVRAATPAAIAGYPTTFSRPLREAVAEYVGVSPDEIMVGCGSSDVIDAAYRTFGRPGARLAHVAPTFIMGRTFAVTNGLDAVAVPLVGGDVDSESILAARADITYLCSPNNPTGACHSAAAVERILGELNGLILLDEAYAEYAGRSLASHAPRHGRLLVFRTFSKAFGMAGLRIGYAVGAASLIGEMEKVRGPYKVTAVAEAAALGALASDLAWMRRTVAETVRVRDDFAAGLRARGRMPLASDANFVLLPVANATATARALLERGIFVRAFQDLAGVGDALRISIGPPDVMRLLISALLDLA